jgi:hypothetical protein
MKCLMIQTKDNRKLLTHQKNYKHLLEYIKTFKAKVFIVKIDKEQKILDLNKLVSALCDKNYKINNLNFEILESKSEKIKIVKKKN